MDGAFRGLDGGAHAFLARLTDEIAGLIAGQSLTVADFRLGQATVWEVRVDQAGAPRAYHWDQPWQALCDGSALSRRKLEEFIRPADPARLLLARTGGAGRDDYSCDGLAADLARELYPAPFFSCAESAEDLIGTAIAGVPITQWYDLVVLRRSVSGTLITTGLRLFPPGARRGDGPCRLTVRCEQADERGTVFAVMARDDDEYPPAYRLVSLESARFQPGTFRVEATLVRPGRVVFSGLPASLTPDSRTWSEVLATVPDRLPEPRPAHLVVVVELCGPTWLFARRVECAKRLVEAVLAHARAPVSYSLLGYVAHAFGRMKRDTPVEVLCWADNAHVMLGALAQLDRRGALTDGTEDTAKLECALHHLHRRLAGHDTSPDRPVVVTIGSRPPFSARRGGDSEVFPCPDKNDWRKELTRLMENHQGIAFGAIHDNHPIVEIWQHLGRHARSRPDAFDEWQFAADLGLVSAESETVPLPLMRDGVR